MTIERIVRTAHRIVRMTTRTLWAIDDGRKGFIYATEDEAAHMNARGVSLRPTTATEQRALARMFGPEPSGLQRFFAALGRIFRIR